MCRCRKANGGRFWYRRDGRLTNKYFRSYRPGIGEYPRIFECNSECLCDSSCVNRVVQHGLRCPVSLEMCGDGKGWGVFALRPLGLGTFLFSFAGEIVDSRELTRRGDDTNCFDYSGLGEKPVGAVFPILLSRFERAPSSSPVFGDPGGMRDGRKFVSPTFRFSIRCFSLVQSEFCLDASRRGNVSRFVNHSCKPNLMVVRVWTEHRDLSFPLFSFFANRDIAEREELTYFILFNSFFDLLGLIAIPPTASL
jgi:[histone H3]-lysine9 N-trimethyltransferase SUV39H